MDKPFVFCVEDNENDIILMQRVFRIKLADYDCIFRTNVEDGKHFLEEAYASKKLPLLVFLDIKLLNSNGLELLKFIKEDARFKDLPTIMLSSSDRQGDKTKAQAFGCDDYVEKPKNYIELKTKIPEIVLSIRKNKIYGSQ